MESKILNRNSYNKNAKDWEEKFSLNNYTHSHIEKPAMLNILGDIKGKDIICIGCGSGEEANLLYERGANVVGFDISEELIKIAKQKYPNINFYVGDAEDFKLEEKFDVAFASFVAHYFPNYKQLLSNTSVLLKENGEFIFSIIHPIKRAMVKEIVGEKKYTILGNSKLTDGSLDTLYGDYLNSKEMKVKFSDGFKMIHYHTTIGEQIRDILDSDFEIIDFVEPKPTQSAKEEYPDKYEIDSKVPEVLIYHLRKKG
jgi:SAM-dependent methyltransferase